MASKNSRVTIKDVAKAAQVSIATVSRVMHGNYYVNPRICERVREVIEESGYLPDSSAAGLKLKYRYMIGYLVSDFSNHQFTAIGRAIEDVIEGRGYSLIVCSNDSQKERELNYLKALLSHRIDGLIINTSGKNDAYIGEISENLPVALVYRKIGSPRFMGDFVGSNNYEGGAIMAETLLREGHRGGAVALLGSDPAINTFQEREAGFRESFAREGTPLNSFNIRYGDYTEEGGYAMTERLLRESSPVTGIGILNNAMAIGAYEYLKEKNIPVPRDISVVSFGDIKNEKLFYVKPAFISQNPQEVGRKAAELILSRIKDPSLAPRREIVSTRFNPGSSVGPPP